VKLQIHQSFVEFGTQVAPIWYSSGITTNGPLQDLPMLSPRFWSVCSVVTAADEWGSAVRGVQVAWPMQRGTCRIGILRTQGLRPICQDVKCTLKPAKRLSTPVRL
jgi:hypothetical protein